MANPFLSLASSNINQIQSGSDASGGCKEKVTLEEERDQLSGMSNWGKIYAFCNEYGFYQGKAVNKLVNRSEDQQISKDHQPPLPNLSPGSSLAPLSVKGVELSHIQKTSSTVNYIKQDNGLSLSSISLEVLSNCRTKLKTSNIQKATDTQNKTVKLSTDQIMRLGGARFIQFSSHQNTNMNLFTHTLNSSLAGLAVDDTQDVKLIQLLLTAAENVSYKEFDGASRLLGHCERLASHTGTPVQRAVFYFAEALMERIERETGWIKSKSREKGDENRPLCSKWKHDPAILAWYQEFPPIQVMNFTAIQTMLETIAVKPKVHLIDIQMRTGVQWAVLMQALAKQDTYPIEHLKITALETTDKPGVETTGRVLQRFARSLNLQFSFQVVFVSDMKDLREEQFNADPGEAIIVNAPFVFRSMITKPICLENLMHVIKSLDPSVLLVAEVEANHNSPTFVNRFIEALFYYGAMFDALEDCMERNNQNRKSIEASIFCPGICNILASEGSERTTRSVRIEVWREFFARFGMIEAEISQSSLYQGHLVSQSFTCRNFCTMEAKNKCLLVGWKGTPLYSLSVWNFS